MKRPKSVNVTKKKCILCKKFKQLIYFGKRTTNFDGISSVCKACVNTRSNAYYKKDPSSARLRGLQYYKDNREACVKRHKEYELTIKNQVFEKYGGYKCTCCGETEKVFLTIDHIHGGGTKHRKLNHGGGKFTYRYLIKHNFPEGYRVLCFNCNSGRALNGGTCPHETENK